MTEQEMETIITELETQFNTPAAEKPVQEKGVAFNRYHHTWPNDRLQEYVTYYGVGLWFDGVLVTTITRVDQWQAFKSVARILSHEKPDATYFIDGIDGGMHTGICVHCDREGLLNSFDACEGCVLAAQLDN